MGRLSPEQTQKIFFIAPTKFGGLKVQISNMLW